MTYLQLNLGAMIKREIVKMTAYENSLNILEVLFAKDY
jgi:hypothetical protein